MERLACLTPVEGLEPSAFVDFFVVIDEPLRVRVRLKPGIED